MTLIELLTLSILWPSLSWFVAIIFYSRQRLLCGRHWHGSWPSFFVAVIVWGRHCTGLTDRLAYHCKYVSWGSFCTTMWQVLRPVKHTGLPSYIRKTQSSGFIQLNNCLHGTAPRYLQDVIQPVAEVTGWSNVAPLTAVCIVLRSCGASNTSFIAWRPSLCGCWTTRIIGAWNSLPEFITDCSSPLTFKKYLKNLFI